jgi:hypothetical protein
MTMNADQMLVCGDCGSEFCFTVGEQEFFAAKGYTMPKRCAHCRALKRARHAATAEPRSVDWRRDTLR